MTQPDDRGAATTVLLAGMALVLVAAALVLNQIAYAGDLRAKAQSAAIAAEEPLRTQAVDFMLGGIDPGGVGYWILGGAGDLPTQEAKRYADRNQGDLTANVHLTGLRGHTARAEVATKECQLIEKRDGPKTDECAGIPIPRTADVQFNTGPKVVPGQEQTGDLVFFDMESTGPGHVGIVVDPKKKIFIEAPHTGDVVKFAHYGAGYPVGLTRPAAGRSA